ncbi:MAG: D-alanine--D-alanine ligase family protein [Myxococcota bacterium]
MASEALDVAVVLGDPRLPYPYTEDGRFGAEDLEAVEHLQAALAKLEGYRFRYLDDHDRLLDDLREARPDLALNLCDTGFRNQWDYERNVPALLEILEIPYTGADPMGISLGTDKSLVRAAAEAMGVSVPDETWVDLAARPLVLPSRYPALVKPNCSGGSFGITRDSVVHAPGEAEAYLRWLAGHVEIPEALVQDYLDGDEYSLALVGNPGQGFTALAPLEVDFSDLDPDLPPLLTYASKTDPDSSYWKDVRFRRARLDEATRATLAGHCERVFRRLGFRDYARFDFRCGADGCPRLLDANTNPTWYWDGKMALMARWAGHGYDDLLRMILEVARARYEAAPGTGRAGTRIA